MEARAAAGKMGPAKTGAAAVVMARAAAPEAAGQVAALDLAVQVGAQGPDPAEVSRA